MMKIATLTLAGALACAVPASAQNITDAQIASIVVTANQVDVDAGRLAASRASDADVRKFGALMVADHSGVNKAAIDLAARLEVTPEDNPTSQALKTAGEKNIAKLKALEGTRSTSRPNFIPSRLTRLGSSRPRSPWRPAIPWSGSTPISSHTRRRRRLGHSIRRRSSPGSRGSMSCPRRACSTTSARCTLRCGRASERDRADGQAAGGAEARPYFCTLMS